MFWQATCDFPSRCEVLSEVHAQLALGQCVRISVPVALCNTVTVFSGYQFLADNKASQGSPSTSCFPGSLVSQPKHPTRVLGTELLLARVHGGIWRPCRHHLGRKTEKEKKSFKALLRLICRQVRFCCVFVIWPCAERRRGLPASPVSAADPDAIPSCPLPLLVKCTRSLATSEQGCPSSNQGSSFLKFLLLQYLGGNDTNNSKS